MICGIFGIATAMFGNSFLEHTKFRRFWLRGGQIAVMFVTETKNIGTFCYKISAAMGIIFMRICLADGTTVGGEWFSNASTIQ